MKFYKTDWFLKISSLVIAIVLWFFVVYQVNPVYNDWVRDVYINKYNISPDFDSGKLVILSITDEDADVKVSGKRQLIARVADGALVRANIDMTGVTGAGKYDLPVNVNFGIDGVDVIQIRPNHCTVVVDRVVTEERSIDVLTKGTVKEGYATEDIVISPSAIKLTGPESIVGMVSQCSITVDLANAADDIKGLYKIKLYDSKGAEITDETITKNIEYTDVYCSVAAAKSVPVVALLSDGKNSDGKTVTAACEPATIAVKGKTDALNGVSQISTELINVYDVRESLEKEVELILPSGVFLVDEQKVKVKFTVSE